MKLITGCVVILLSGVACSQGDSKLTPERAEQLLPEAASIRFKDLEALGQGNALPETNQSPTYFVLTFKPPQPPEKRPKDYEKDFAFTSINPAKLAEAITVSKDRGFASIIQPQYITECTCDSDGQQARGRVAFKCDAFSGAIGYKAAKVKGEWMIREFDWPHLGVRFVRGEDGNWNQEKIKN
jgi:hypothetical protein